MSEGLILCNSGADGQSPDGSEGDGCVCLRRRTGGAICPTCARHLTDGDGAGWPSRIPRNCACICMRSHWEAIEMFTGIVEELGAVLSRGDIEDQVVRLRIGANNVLADATLGASIAVNGCCLTVVEFEPAAGGSAGWWEADVSLETLQRTNLGSLGDGDPVNLERPVRLQDRLGGHLVQGHVDAVGTIIEPAPDLRIQMDPGLTRYIVEKGSITVDGISLTVVDALDDGFSVAIIPHTEAVTTLSSKGPGDVVNVEVDITAKHIEKLLAWHTGNSETSDETAVSA
jgi:riboflavin synthase